MSQYDRSGNLRVATTTCIMYSGGHAEQTNQAYYVDEQIRHPLFEIGGFSVLLTNVMPMSHKTSNARTGHSLRCQYLIWNRISRHCNWFSRRQLNDSGLYAKYGRFAAQGLCSRDTGPIVCIFAASPPARNLQGGVSFERRPRLDNN